jgi:hypothetical protein
VRRRYQSIAVRCGSFSTDERCLRDVRFPPDRYYFKDDATADELRAEINRRLTVLQKAGIIELQPLPAPEVQ